MKLHCTILTQVEFGVISLSLFHSYDGYSVYMPSFNSFLSEFTLACQTFDLIFMQIVGHIIMNQIPTKVGTRFALMSPLCMPNFSLIKVCIHILWQILKEVEENMEEKPETLVAEVIFFKFGIKTPLGTSVAIG